MYLLFPMVVVVGLRSRGNVEWMIRVTGNRPDPVIQTIDVVPKANETERMTFEVCRHGEEGSIPMRPKKVSDVVVESAVDDERRYHYRHHLRCYRRRHYLL